MKQAFKRILASIFLRDKFVGQIAGAAAGAVAALICSELVPLIPDLVENMVIAALIAGGVKLQPGAELTQPVVAMVLTPFFGIVFNALIAEFLLKRSAAVQTELKKADLYTDKVDRWIGDNTLTGLKEGLAKLSDVDLSSDYR